MDKRCFIIGVFFLISVFFGLPLFAEAPELRNVMPNSWQKVTRLSPAGEADFLQNNKAIISKIKGFFKSLYSSIDSMDGKVLPNEFAVYRQNTGEHIFYRLICTTETNPNFMSNGIRFIHFLVLNNKIILGGGYNLIDRNQRNDIANFTSIDIVNGKNHVKAIMITHIRAISGLDGWRPRSYRKGQLFGEVTANYYTMDNIKSSPGVSSFFDSRAYPLVDEALVIDASDCLVDPICPLKYSLQNVFDGDPATSYVENTDDDLMRIHISYMNIENIQQIAIINGYAQNYDLYKKNNRIRRITASKYQWDIEHTDSEKVYIGEKLLLDDTLSYQNFEVIAPSEINVSDLYSGMSYNDTCMAEFNIKTKSGWLFGDLDE